MGDSLTQESLNGLFVEHLGSGVSEHGPLPRKPLDLHLQPPLPPYTRLYLYNATTPSGGRIAGECKIQLLVPGQSPGERANFDWTGGRSVLLAGFNSEYQVFILWDAGLHVDFAYCKNVQIKPETLFRAAGGEIATQVRGLRPGKGHEVQEVVVASSGRLLGQAIRHRVDLTRRRLAGLPYV